MKYIYFDFIDYDGFETKPIMICIEEDISDKEIDEINNKLQSITYSYFENNKYWCSNDKLICDVMNNFNYNWHFVCADRIIKV
jgi:hypothetical protein